MNRNIEILKMRNSGKSFQEIANIYKITRQRVEQICKNPSCGNEKRGRKKITITKDELLLLIYNSDIYKQNKHKITVYDAAKIEGCPNHRYISNILGVNKNKRLSNILKDYEKNIKT